MVSFTETAALEWAVNGVRVNAVAPGYIASSGMDHYPPEAGDMLRAMRKTVPQGRFGTEAEVSAAIVFLLSPAASFINGTTLRVDGARPQVRLGWPMKVPDAQVQQRPAVRPFNGFHRATTPKVFQESPHPDPLPGGEGSKQRQPPEQGKIPTPSPSGRGQG
jgi:citronellol/citronellal dehydrogenase